MRKKQSPQNESSEAKLKVANKKLRAQVRQLRKQLKQQQQLVSSWAELEITPPPPNAIDSIHETEESHAVKCKKCKSPTLDIPAGVFTIRKCEDEECGWRVKLKGRLNV